MRKSENKIKIYYIDYKEVLEFKTTFMSLILMDLYYSYDSTWNKTI